MQKKFVVLNGKLVADYTFSDPYDYKTHRSFLTLDDQKKFDKIYLSAAIMPEIHFPEPEGCGVGGSLSSGSGPSSNVAGLGSSTGNGLDGNTKPCPPDSGSAGGPSLFDPIPADPNSPAILVKITCQTGILKGEVHYHNLFVTAGTQKLFPRPKKLKKTPLVPHGFVAEKKMAAVLLDVVKTLNRLYDPDMLLLGRWKGFGKVGGGGEIDATITIGEALKELGEVGKVLVLIPIIGKEKENQEPGRKHRGATQFREYTDPKGQRIPNRPSRKGILHEYIDLPASDDELVKEHYESLFWGVGAATQRQMAIDLPMSGPEELDVPPELEPGILAELEPFEVLFGETDLGFGMTT